jgi:hypothetical protein
MGTIVGSPKWQPKGITSADLKRAYRAAMELQRTPLPPQLGKALSGFIMRAGVELRAREIDPLKLAADGRDQ